MKTPSFEGCIPKTPIYLDPIVKSLIETGPPATELTFLRWDTCYDCQINNTEEQDNNQENVYNANTNPPSEKLNQNSDEKSAKKSLSKDVNPLVSQCTPSKEPFGPSEAPAEVCLFTISQFIYPTVF